MQLSGATRVQELLEAHPYLIDFLAGYHPKFHLLKNPVMRITIGRVATLKMVAAMGEIELGKLLRDVQQAIKAKTRTLVEIAETLPEEDRQAKVEALKAIIQGLHASGDMNNARQQFNLLLQDVQADEIRHLEEDLVKQGMPVQEIQRLCDLHVGVFKDALEKKQEASVPPGHPVHTYQQENRLLEARVEALDCLLKALGQPPDKGKMRELKPEFQAAVAGLAPLELHYVRKENQLFPFMEKHGITAPPQVMWGVHNEIRALGKQVRQALAADDAHTLAEQGAAWLRAVVEMIYKEEKILFPMVLNAFSQEEWNEIRHGEDELGYAVAPGQEWQPNGGGQIHQKENRPMQSQVTLKTGGLTMEQLDLMLKHLPVDVSFVDEQDEVRYYNDVKDRIFPRSPGVIGRKVQQCHPPKSVHMVQQILDEFKAGRKNTAEFWLDLHGRKLHIRYFAVRDQAGQYRGTLEVSQDITAIQRLAGERRLLDWEKP
ncbi:MAG: DUF438 domain-containing protein [candidate division FCPU426 bacterium]